MSKQDEVYITKKWHISKKIILAVLVAAAVIAWFWVVYDIHTHQINRTFHRNYSGRTILSRKPGTIQDVQTIQSWMTFDYINVFFHIPVSEFQNKLNITDTNYPHITIKKLASEQNISSSELTQQVKNIVSGYLEASTTPH